MNHAGKVQKKCFGFVTFVVKCLFIWLAMYGAFSLYYTVFYFNARLNELEDQSFEDDMRMAFMEQRTANCYPND